jgi:bifunctional non-homologous end joining protein LigD
MPLDWSELSTELGPDYFTVTNALPRLAGLTDPWQDFRKAAVPLS